MNTYAEVIFQTKKLCQIAKVKFQDNNLYLTFPRLSQLYRHIIIPLEKINSFTKINYFGTTQLCFYYGDYEYILFESGLGTFEFLEDHFPMR